MEEKEQEKEVTQEAGDPFVPTENEKLVLDELGLSGKRGETLMFTCKVLRFTVESKVSGVTNYENARGYMELEPAGHYLHIPIQDPARLVNGDGDLGIMKAAIHQIATMLDMAVSEVAHRRTDRQIVSDEIAARTAPSRADVKKVVRKEAKKEEGVLL